MIDLITKVRFKKLIGGIAEGVKKEYGIAPLLLITQAAHESNWGESELTRIANNLFGMTATKSWYEAKKDIYCIPTKEYSPYSPSKIRYWNREGDIIEKKDDGHGGSILKVKVDFRKYRNWDESCLDWAKKIAMNPRYQEAYKHASSEAPGPFFEALQEGGYATDPSYAKKLISLYDVVKNLPEEENETTRIG